MAKIASESDKIACFCDPELPDKIFVVGTNRERTEMDNILDEIVLEKYYGEHNETRTPEKDSEILKNSYLKQKL